MTAYRYEYTPIPVPLDASPGMQSALSALNEQLSHIAQALAKIQGLNNLTPEFVNSPDFGGYKLQNLATGTLDSDAVRRDQIFLLENLASVLLGTAEQITITDNGDDTLTFALASELNYTDIEGLLALGRGA